jgi:hypothetical protein
MPHIQFDQEHEVKGFYFLATREQIAFLPNRTYVISENLFEQLKKSEIPFRVITPKLAQKTKKAKDR